MFLQSRVSCTNIIHFLYQYWLTSEFVYVPISGAMEITVLNKARWELNELGTETPSIQCSCLMAPPKKRARVQAHNLSSSESDSSSDDNLPSSSTRTETLSHFSKVEGKLERTDTQIEVTASPRKARAQAGPSGDGASSVTPRFPLASSNEVQETDSDPSVADTAAWLHLLQLDSSTPWDPSDIEKARQEQAQRGTEGGNASGEKGKQKEDTSAQDEKKEGGKKRKRTSAVRLFRAFRSH